MKLAVALLLVAAGCGGPQATIPDGAVLTISVSGTDVFAQPLICGGQIDTGKWIASFFCHEATQAGISWFVAGPVAYHARTPDTMLSLYVWNPENVARPNPDLAIALEDGGIGHATAVTPFSDGAGAIDLQVDWRVAP